MSKVIEIAEENFEAEVLQSELPVLVDFTFRERLRVMYGNSSADRRN